MLPVISTSVRLKEIDLESLKVIAKKHGEYAALSQSDLIRIAINEYAKILRAEEAKTQATVKPEN